MRSMIRKASKQHGQGRHDVHEPHDQIVGLASAPAGQCAQGQADAKRDHLGEDRDAQRNPRAVDDAAVLVAAGQVHAHPEVGIGKRARGPHKRFVVVVVGDQRFRRPAQERGNKPVVGKDRKDKEPDHNDQPDHSQPVAEKTPRSIAPEAALGQHSDGR